MRKRFRKSSLYRFLGHEAVTSEVLSSHAFGKVARESGPGRIPTSKPSPLYQRQIVPRYRDSMLAHSATHFRVKVPERPAKDPAAKDASADTSVIGNRPKSGKDDKGAASSDTLKRRHHFIEPPKRGFNRFG